MQRTKPPFRADQVGSLLRTAPVKEARTQRLAGEITPAESEGGRGRRDQEARRQAGIDRPAGGDRRRVPPLVVALRFPGKLDGVELVSVAQGLQFKGTQTKAEGLHVHGKIDFSADHPMLEHFRFLKSVAKAVPKMTIPSPTALHFAAAGRRSRNRSIPRWSRSSPISARPTARRCARSARRAAPTCSSTRCIVAYLCDDGAARDLRGRGDDPDKLLHVYADLVNAACAGRTPGMTISHASLPRQLPLDLDGAGRLRAGRRHPVQPDERRRLFHGIRHRARRRLRAAALAAARASRSCSAS